MKLYVVLLLSALFAYSDCMNLSNVSQISIRKILNNRSGITDSENYMTSVDGLGRAFSHVDELGSIELAEALVRALRARELSENEIIGLVLEAVRVGNTNAYVYFSRNVFCVGSVEVLRIAAANGHLDILDREHQKGVKNCYAYVGQYVKILPGAVRAGHFHVLQWFAENELLRRSEAREALIEALEINRQDMINFLLHEPVYVDDYRTGLRFTYEQCMRNGQFYRHDKVLIKAAEVGNMNVIQYYLERNLLTTRGNLQAARNAAAANGHNEIVALIDLFRAPQKKIGK